MARVLQVLLTERLNRISANVVVALAELEKSKKEDNAVELADLNQSLLSIEENLKEAKRILQSIRNLNRTN